MKKILMFVLLMASASGCSQDGRRLDTSCDVAPYAKYEDAVVCYREKVEQQPLQYQLVEETPLPGLNQLRYQMRSQNWSPEQRVQPAEWQHDVTIYIPDRASRTTALLIANNGVRFNTPASPPTDFSEAVLGQIARDTRTIVVSVSDLPNQYLS